MTESLVTICLDCAGPVLDTCINTTEWYCLEGVRMYYDYEHLSCYQGNIGCALTNWWLSLW